MNEINKTITTITFMAIAMVLIASATMYVLGYATGKIVAYEQFQSEECKIDKSNDVVCITHIKDGE